MEEKRKENQRILWNSLEMGGVKRNIIIYLILLPIFCALSFVRLRDPEAQMIMCAVMALLIAPFLIFYLARLVRILLRAEEYVFCRTILSKPHASLNRDLFYFSVVLKDKGGKEFMTDTHAIFANRSLFDSLLENYVNQEVAVAYNPVTGMVVVIG